MAWDLLYDEYGHSHEVARCCEERLRSAPKVPEDDREKLKSLANLLEKCCVSLKGIWQTSSLDSMHVMMSVIVTNKEICFISVVFILCKALRYLFARLPTEGKTLFSSQADCCVRRLLRQNRYDDIVKF